MMHLPFMSAAGAMPAPLGLTTELSGTFTFTLMQALGTLLDN